MKKGIPVGTEVGGLFSVEQAWWLIRAYEETGTFFMLMENLLLRAYRADGAEHDQKGV